MSAEAVLHAALMAALGAASDVGGALNGVYAGPPVKATPPYAELQPMIAIDWSTKDAAGRELRPAVTLHDAGDGPARLHALIGAACVAIEGLPREIDGWRVASLAFGRSRTLATAPGRWAATIEYRVRMLSL